MVIRIKYLEADGVRHYGKAAQSNGGQKIYIWEEPKEWFLPVCRQALY
jgi:hypothetical protein